LPEAITLSVTDGIRFDASLDPGGLELLRLLDGTRSFGEALTTFANEIGADRKKLQEVTIPFVQGLLRLGVLTLPNASERE